MQPFERRIGAGFDNILPDPVGLLEKTKPLRSLRGG